VHEYFIALSRRQTMTLLTALTFAGREALDAFDHLPEDEAELLRQRAVEILRIPRERRVPLMVREMKRLIAERRGQLWAAHPERLARILANERSTMVDVALRALPVATAEAVRRRLPARSPPVRAAAEPKPQILQLVKCELEEALARDAQAAGPARFEFSDVLLLTSRELSTLCDRLGARLLAPALAGLSEAAREPFLGGVRPDLRQLAVKNADAAASRALPEDDARQMLARHDGHPPSGMRSAGARSLARAALSRSRELAEALTQRHRNNVGQLLLHWIRDEGPIPPRAKIDDGGDVLFELERLAQDGVIDRVGIRERRGRWRVEK
jgi:hypothetical protein